MLRQVWNLCCLGSNACTRYAMLSFFCRFRFAPQSQSMDPAHICAPSGTKDHHCNLWLCHHVYHWTLGLYWWSHTTRWACAMLLFIAWLLHLLETLGGMDLQPFLQLRAFQTVLTSDSWWFCAIHHFKCPSSNNCISRSHPFCLDYAWWDMIARLSLASFCYLQ